MSPPLVSQLGMPGVPESKLWDDIVLRGATKAASGGIADGAAHAAGSVHTMQNQGRLSNAIETAKICVLLTVRA